MVIKILKPIYALNRISFRLLSTKCSQPKIFKINQEIFKQLITPELDFLNELFKKHNYELKIAGGAVRDVLLDCLPHDVDLATNALPQQMLDIFDKENVRVLNLNGIKHGTVPVRIRDKANFEITTLRIDVKTDGRHADVEFTNDWHLDAMRRDLTINALFLDFDGNIYDYVNGAEDIKNRVIRFVGVADKRIKEDYLRILRYFRFYSRVCSICENHDVESINAIKNNVDGLQKISGERIGYELRKILIQKFADSFMKMFYEFNIHKYLGFPENGNVDEFCRIYNQSFKNSPQPMTLLAALMTCENDIEKLNSRLKLSRLESHAMHAIWKYKNKFREEDSDKLLSFIKQEMVRPNAVLKSPLDKNDVIEILKYVDRVDLIDQAKRISLPLFMVKQDDLSNHVVKVEHINKTMSLNQYTKEINGIKFNSILTDLKIKWIDSDFKISKGELLNIVNENYLKDFLREKKLNKNKN